MTCDRMRSASAIGAAGVRLSTPHWSVTYMDVLRCQGNELGVKSGLGGSKRFSSPLPVPRRSLMARSMKEPRTPEPPSMSIS